MELTFEHSPFAELIDGKHFGPAALEEKDWLSDWSCHIAESPASFALDDLYRTAGVEIPKDLALYDRFTLWMIPHRLSIVRRGGIAKPKKVELEVEFRDDSRGLNPKMTLFVVSQLPAPQFTLRAKVNATITGKIQANGEAVVTAPEVALPNFTFKSGGLSLGAATTLEAGVFFRQEIATPIVSAVGVGSSRSQWLLTEAELPLYGRDIECWTVLALPKIKKKLSYRMRVRLHIRKGLLDVPRESAWKTITCELTRPAVPEAAL